MPLHARNVDLRTDVAQPAYTNASISSVYSLSIALSYDRLIAMLLGLLLMDVHIRLGCALSFLR